MPDKNAEQPTIIYLYCVPAVCMCPGDVLGYAVAQDGHALASHLSSSVAWSKHDMGLTSDWKHNVYKQHCPEGYTLQWVYDPENHEGLQAALALNKELWQKGYLAND